MEKEFVYCPSNKCVYYNNLDGNECFIDVSGYLNSKDVTIEQIEKDFDEMLVLCDKECDARNRKDLFIFCYAVIKGWIK